MIKLLLLSCGTNACYHCAKTLKENFEKDFYIVGADINEQYLISTCNYLDMFYKVPCSSSSGYYETILEICKKENINYILPIFDLDQKLFYKDNPDLIKLGVVSLGINKTTAILYENKETMSKALSKFGFRVPQEFSNKEVNENFKYFIKPKDGSGSTGIKIETGVNIKKFNSEHNFLIQEICSEPEYTVECFNFNKISRTITRERLASKAGVCTKTKIFNNLELENIVKNFARKIDCPYCFNLQFMKNLNNEFVITDVNLRLAGGMSLSYAAGWDEISALAKIMLNKKEDEIFETLPEQIKPQYVVRAYTDIVTKIEKPIVAFDFDGTLLDSRKRHQVVLDDILKKYKIKVDTSGLVEFKRSGKNNVDFLISKGVDEKIAKDIQKEWISKIENVEYLELDVLYPEALDMLKNYSKDNDLILVTARNNKAGLEYQIDKFNLRQYFQNIFIVPSNKNTTSQKTEILKNQNVTLMIGDTCSDALAAQNAEVAFKFHDNGFNSEYNLKGII